MSSHKCLYCIGGRVTRENPYDDRACEYCGGSGWILDDYDVPYYPISLPVKGEEE